MRTRLIAAALLLAGGTAGAWVARPDREAPEVAAAGRQPRAERTLLPARVTPGGWQGVRDRDTGVVAELWGSYVPAPGAVADPKRAAAAARAFVTAHLALLAPGARIEDFVLAGNDEARGLRTVGFRQTWRGAPVIGGQLAVMIKNDRVFAATSQALPGVTLDVPARTAAVSTRRAEDWIGGRVVTRAIGPRVILPIAGATGALEYRVADQLDVEALDRPGRWDIFVGIDGAPLLRSSQLRFATSTLTYDVGVRYPLGARHDATVPQAAITADSVATITATDGSFSWAGTSAAAVEPGLTGTLVTIENGAGPLATASLTAQPGTPVQWSLAADEYGDAQLSAFINAGIAKARARVLLPSLATWLDQALVVSVNEDDVCNAYSTGDDIHFFRKGMACENTGRLADVVAHELGHSLHKHAIVGGSGAFIASLSEGLSDLFAATIVEDHGLGRGFLFDDRALRDLDPEGSEAIWPRDKSGDPHITGLIIGGTLWDLRQALIAQFGPIAGRALTDVVFAGVLRNAPDIPGAYLAARTADDDDGDLGNGTPHACAIEAAFGRHGLAGPTFQTTQVGVPVVTGTSFSVPVTVPVTACLPPQVTNVQLRWHIGAAAPGVVDFAPSGASWVGALPAVPDNSIVAYTITAKLDDGSSITYPDNPADPEYTLFAGTPAEIWCERFDADPQWTQSGANDWQWAMPAPISVSGDPTATHAGAAMFGTDLTGDGRYTGDTSTTIFTPAIDASMYDQVRLQYWRWLTVEDATYDTATIAVNGTTVWTNALTASGGLDHIDREWRFQDVDLTAYASGPLQLGWSIASDMSRELGGWTLDEVCVVGIGKHQICGDNVVDDGEECDHGDTDDGDGCSATCTREDLSLGGCCSAGTDPSGPLLLGLGVVALIARRRRHRLTRAPTGVDSSRNPTGVDSATDFGSRLSAFRA